MHIPVAQEFNFFQMHMNAYTTCIRIQCIQMHMNAYTSCTRIQIYPNAQEFKHIAIAREFNTPVAQK